MLRLVLVISCCLGFAAGVLAQDAPTTIDKKLVPAEASNVKQFAPAGWKIEAQVEGDLNGDGLPDYALKLIEDKSAKDKDDTPIGRQRALVVVLQEPNGKFMRAAVADKLLQCPDCGGAFYGVGEAPANVKIEKGVIVVEQDYGSRWTTDLTLRFRYEQESQKFLLIGFDIVSNDRIERNTVTESTNYLTGVRIVKRFRQRETTSRTHVAKTKIYMDDVDYQKFDEEANKRLGL
jgi:hypothetical protein